MDHSSTRKRVASLRIRKSRESSRDVAAWLCRRPASGTLWELAPAFGVRHPDSVRNLVRRIDRALSTFNSVRKDVATLKTNCWKPKTGSDPAKPIWLGRNDRDAWKVSAITNSVACHQCQSRDFRVGANVEVG